MSDTKSHPLQALHGNKCGEPFKTLLHAEVAAIVNCRDLSRAHKISVYRYSESGKPLIAKPCKICQSAIAATGIKNIEFTVTE